MAYSFGQAYRVGDTVFLKVAVSTQEVEQIRANEYGSANFDTFVPCFNTLCSLHNNFRQCCIATCSIGSGASIQEIMGYAYGDEPALVYFNPVDTCLSMPYSNTKISLVYEDYVKSDNVYEDYLKIREERADAGTEIKRANPLVYKGYLYYVQIRCGKFTQYRVSLKGGNPERVFEADNIIIKTIINDKIYGVRYDDGIGEQPGLASDREKMHYFRSDMNDENIESLPETLDYYRLTTDDVFNLQTRVLLDADSEFIYVLDERKVWAIPESDINAEPVLLLDLEEKISFDLERGESYRALYADGVIYAYLGTGSYTRNLLNEEGYKKEFKWKEKMTFCSLNIKTGECKSRDISNENYLLIDMHYADDNYIYGLSNYLHEDGRVIQGVTTRLTLDTMRYEVILPPRFLENNK